jgi:hypothetical protein
MWNFFLRQALKASSAHPGFIGITEVTFVQAGGTKRVAQGPILVRRVHGSSA